MKAKTFENLIRKVVREEIDYSLRREIKSLKEDLRDELKPTIVEHTERIVEVPSTPEPQRSEKHKNTLREKIMGPNTTPDRPIIKQNFTKDSSLNALLNETAQGNTNTQIANAPVSLERPFSSGAPMSEDTTGMPTDVAKAVTRDYSDLMGAILKKKGK